MKDLSTYKIIGIAIISACLVLPTISSAQQYPISTQFLTNHFVYSPAFAGVEGEWKGNLSYRKEWVGIQGAPISKFLNVNGPVGKKGGFGASFMTENIGMLQNFNGSLSYAYHLEVADGHVVSFGVNGGFYENRLNLSDVYLDDNTDDVFLNATSGYGTSYLGTSTEIGTGINYTFSDATIGVSVPNLLKNPMLYQNQASNVLYRSARHYLVHASFQFGILSDSLKFEPIIVARFSEKGPSQIEAGILTKYQDWVWLGLGFRQSGIYFASLGGMVSDKINVLYTYEFGFAGITSKSRGTHEIGMGFNISGGGSKKDDVLEDMKPLIDSLGGVLAELDARLDSDSILIDSLDKRVTILEMDVVDSKDVVDADIGGIKATQEELRIDLHGEANLSIVSPVDGAPSSLIQGHYVVIESFRSFSNAKVAIIQWKNRGKESFIVYNSEREWYYVYLAEYDSSDQARKDRDAMREAGYNDVWIHRVD